MTSVDDDESLWLSNTQDFPWIIEKRFDSIQTFIAQVVANETEDRTFFRYRYIVKLAENKSDVCVHARWRLGKELGVSNDYASMMFLSVSSIICRRTHVGDGTRFIASVLHHTATVMMKLTNKSAAASFGFHLGGPYNDMSRGLAEKCSLERNGYYNDYIATIVGQNIEKNIGTGSEEETDNGELMVQK